jgi:hypothetical protein
MLAPFPMLDVVQASCAIMELVKLIHVPHWVRENAKACAFSNRKYAILLVPS